MALEASSHDDLEDRNEFDSFLKSYSGYLQEAAFFKPQYDGVPRIDGEINHDDLMSFVDYLRDHREPLIDGDKKVRKELKEFSPELAFENTNDILELYRKVHMTVQHSPSLRAFLIAGSGAVATAVVTGIQMSNEIHPLQGAYLALASGLGAAYIAARIVRNPVPAANRILGHLDSVTPSTMRKRILEDNRSPMVGPKVS